VDRVKNAKHVTCDVWLWVWVNICAQFQISESVSTEAFFDFLGTRVELEQ